MAKTFHYFNINGLGESIRYMLHYAGEKFQDKRYPREQWPIQSVKSWLPYGQLPIYEEEDRRLNQSLAIARYLAAKTHLLPTDPWAQALLDATVFNIYDFWSKVGSYIKETDETRKKQLRKEILTDHVDYYFSRFEKELKAKGGYFGGELSWADFILIGIVESFNLFLDTEIEKKYPTVDALCKKIRSLPGVKDYIANRQPYSI